MNQTQHTPREIVPPVYENALSEEEFHDLIGYLLGSATEPLD